VSGPANGATAAAGANAGAGWLARVELGGDTSGTTESGTCEDTATPAA
jgi:hypothetical protein